MTYKIEIFLTSDEPVEGERIFETEMYKYFKWCAEEFVRAKPQELEFFDIRLKDIKLSKKREPIP